MNTGFGSEDRVKHLQYLVLAYSHLHIPCIQIDYQQQVKAQYKFVQ